MKDILKVSLRGLLVVLLLPFILLLLCLYTIYCVIGYIISLFKNLFVFFSGGTVGVFKEDVEAKKLLEVQTENQQNMANTFTNFMNAAIQQNTMNMYNQQNLNSTENSEHRDPMTNGQSQSLIDNNEDNNNG